ncbi:Wadjet anti-phage system protein JetA family protein [Holdemania filiformis]|uniref:Wadjet anti-phage system protein JetA family protein n=1 Tax=Holdemania filiformis TaxID=61171 RepID=UPI00242B97FA|nr:Wadjet anti-phage system protein JetA family protein [Holdemania filiformis]
MELFKRIPDKFFNILTSRKKELYVEALFVLRQAFKTELVIKREDLISMLVNSLENNIIQADFSEEAQEMGVGKEEQNEISGKAHLLIRKLRDTGWIELEYERNSFDENITIPDYAIDVINLLYDLSVNRVKEYNSYVYATYAAIKNSGENSDYLYQALQAAYQNTVKLVDELKLLFNNIKRYYQKIHDVTSINALLEEHFDQYKEQIIDTFYYPLKTIDSVPRFKYSILSNLNEWIMDERIISNIVTQGVNRHVFSDEIAGRDETLHMINSIADTYESIEGMITEIDKKHIEYINASIDRIRYQMNADRSIKGKLITVLKHIDEEKVFVKMNDHIEAYQHGFMDMQSLYNRVKRTVKTEGKPLPILETKENLNIIEGFLSDVKKQYSNKKIDKYINECFNGKQEFFTEDAIIKTSEDFILFLLGTLRGREKSARYQVEFTKGNINLNGYSLPRLHFIMKNGAKDV